MTFEQTVQLLGVIGTWFAGGATIIVAMVALFLARRSERVRLQAGVGLRLMITPGLDTQEECLQFRVTNHGERPVTIDTVGWRIGKGKQKKFCIQVLSTHSPDNYPKKIEHGETATFIVGFKECPDWMREFATDFVTDVSDKALKTLRAQIHTSVETVEVAPEQELLDRLKKAHNL